MSQTQQHNEHDELANFKLPVKRVDGETVEERLTANAYEKILPARYLQKDENGEVTETVEEMFRRVARNVAIPDKEYDDYDYEESAQEFFDLMTNLAFMPNSPTLMNAGAELQQLSACFVVHPEDDMDSIFNAVHDAAKIFQTGGGVGYPFHLMRPKGDLVGSTGGIASGPLTFQNVFDQMCGTIKQGGKRRGAQMGIMRVDHPDVLRFIVAKRKEGNLSNFNISVGLTDDFMAAVRNDEEYTLINPRTGEPHEVTAETAQFYNSDEDWWPTAEGSDSGREDNFWRDLAQTFDDIEEYDIDLEPGETMTLPARFIWDCLIDGAWRNGEPGLFMYDKANDMHSIDVDEHPEHRMEATNPCVTGDTLISTDQGMISAEELHRKQVATNVVVDGRLSGDAIQDASSVYKTGEKDVYKLRTEEGYELRLTSDHQVMTEDGWKEAQNLSESDTVHIVNRKGSFGTVGTVEEGRVIGWLVGDGQIKQNEERAVLHFYDGDTSISDEFAGYVNTMVREPVGNGDYEVGVQQITRREGHRQHAAAQEKRVRSTRLYEAAEKLGLTENKLQVPQDVFKGSEAMARGFLQALFTADGSVQGNVEKGVSVRLSSSKRNLLVDVQRLLLNFGIASTIYKRRDANTRELPDGSGGTKPYDVDAQYDLTITKDNMVVFADEIGFLRSDKQNRLEELLDDYDRGPYQETFTATVASAERDGHEPVYDLTEPTTHSFVANGLVVHNCGEQPLENYEACNLGHINLSLLVEDQSAGTGLNWHDWQDRHEDAYDWDEEYGRQAAMRDFLEEALRMDRFEYVAKTGTRFLDNVVTMSDFPLQEIEEKVTNMRKIGLGIMGFAQMLIQVGIRYGSADSFLAAKEIQRLVTRFSVEESRELAKTRGAFGEWEKSKWANPTEYPDWFERYSGGMTPEQHEGGLRLRNHNTVTIAPTGTTSMIGDTSGGCEPIFSLAYFKNVAKDIQGDDMLVEFDDYFLKALEANDVDLDEVKDDAENKMRNNEWDGVHSIDDDILPPAVKELFVTADRVTPEEHVRIQAAFQEHNHSGISKTCNFPNDATRDDVKEAYLLAHELGVKGLTVYRDGTRDVQVLTTRADNKLEDMDKQDMFNTLIEEYGSPEELVTSPEFVRAAGLSQENGLVVQQNGDGSFHAQTINPDTPMAQAANQSAEQDSETRARGQPRERPETISGTTQKIETGYGGMYVTINEDDEGIFEVFCQLGKSGGFTESFTDAIGRLISTSLRCGVDPDVVVNQLEGIRSPRVAWDDSEQVLSVPDGVAKAMKRYLEGEASQAQTSVASFSQEAAEQAENTAKDTVGAAVSAEPADPAPDADGPATDTGSPESAKELVSQGMNPECPDCGGMMELQEGCKKCPGCGFSECG